jgi:hypothetical protein
MIGAIFIKFGLAPAIMEIFIIILFKINIVLNNNNLLLYYRSSKLIITFSFQKDPA